MENTGTEISDCRWDSRCSSFSIAATQSFCAARSFEAVMAEKERLEKDFHLCHGQERVASKPP